MTSFNLSPETWAKLQQSGRVSPETVAAAGQRQVGPMMPQGSPFAANVGPMAAKFAIQPGPGPSAPPPRAPAPKQRRIDPRIDAFAGVAAAFELPNYIATAGPTMITTGAFPKEIVNRAGLKGFLELKNLSDDEFVVALRLAHQGSEGWGDENKKDLYGKFSAVVAERPELKKKLVQMMEQEKAQAAKKQRKA